MGAGAQTGQLRVLEVDRYGPDDLDHQPVELLLFPDDHRAPGVDLLVAGHVALPGRLVVQRDPDLHVEARLARRRHRLQVRDVRDRLRRGLAHGEAPIEAEDEAVGHGAVARRLEPRPRRRARAGAEELVVLEADAVAVGLGRLGEDGAPVLQRVPALPRHRAVARAPGDGDLDLHPPALSAVDAQGALRRVAGALGEQDHVGDDVGGRAREDLPGDVLGPAAVVVLLGRGGVRANDHAVERAFAGQLQHDLRGHDLRDHPAELVGGAAPEEQVPPLVVGRQPPELATQEVAVGAVAVDEAVVGVDAAPDLVDPLPAERAHGVGVPVEVDDPLVGGRDPVRRVLQDPDEVAVLVEVHVVRAAYGADLDDLATKVLEARALVIAQAALGVAAFALRAVDVVGGDADRLGEDLRGERSIPGGELAHPGVQVGHAFSCLGQGVRASSRATRSGFLATASSAMTT